MAGRLAADTTTEKIQVITPYSVEAIAASGTFTPVAGQRAFRVDGVTNVQIDGAGDSYRMSQGETWGIVAAQTYLFDTAVNLCIM